MNVDTRIDDDEIRKVVLTQILQPLGKPRTVPQIECGRFDLCPQRLTFLRDGAELIQFSSLQ